MIRLRILTIAMATLSTASLFAQSTEAEQPEEPKLSVQPIGRALIDAAMYITPDDQFKDGVALPEARLGAVATYGKLKGKVELGYQFGKIVAKDIYAQVDFNKQMSLRVGNFIHNFGLQSATSSSMRPTFETPVSNNIFDTARLLGAMYVYNSPSFLGAGSVYAESNALTNTANSLGGTGWGALTRLVVRSHYNGTDVAQIGWSGGFASPQYNSDSDLNHHSYSFSSNFPSRVNAISAVGTTISDARTMFKMSPELLVSYSRFALESQYYFMQVNRKNGLDAFKAYGAYATLRTLLCGAHNYPYSAASAGLTQPSAKTLELVLGYDYVNLNSGAIKGGRLSDVSCTLNWYINKFFIWRLRYSYTHSWERANYADVDLGILQTRFQFIF